MFGFEDVEQSLAEARVVLGLWYRESRAMQGGREDGTFRKSNSAWRRTSALASRVAWMRFLKADASMFAVVFKSNDPPVVLRAWVNLAPLQKEVFKKRRALGLVWDGCYFRVSGGIFRARPRQKTQAARDSDRRCLLNSRLHNNQNRKRPL